MHISVCSDMDSRDGGETDPIMDQTREFGSSESIEQLAKAIHEAYLPHASPAAARPWDELPDNLKEDNRAAARRIPDVLALIGLEIQKRDELPMASDRERDNAEQVRVLIDRNLETLSEAEHNGWMSHKMKNGWHYDPVRNDNELLHNLLVPYEQLSEEEKDKDRRSVLDYAKHVWTAGCRIACSSRPGPP